MVRSEFLRSDKSLNDMDVKLDIQIIWIVVLCFCVGESVQKGKRVIFGIQKRYFNSVRNDLGKLDFRFIQQVIHFRLLYCYQFQSFTINFHVVKKCKFSCFICLFGALRLIVFNTFEPSREKTICMLYKTKVNIYILFMSK